MDVIKYNGRPDVFVWKYPGEELGTWSQLVVNQSQEAVLVNGWLYHRIRMCIWKQWKKPRTKYKNLLCSQKE